MLFLSLYYLVYRGWCDHISSHGQCYQGMVRAGYLISPGFAGVGGTVGAADAAVVAGAGAAGGW